MPRRMLLSLVAVVLCSAALPSCRSTPAAAPEVRMSRFISKGRTAFDHPKRILYRRESADRMTARIEGDEGGKPVSEDFLYTRL